MLTWLDALQYMAKDMTAHFLQDLRRYDQKIMPNDSQFG